MKQARITPSVGVWPAVLLAIAVACGCGGPSAPSADPIRSSSPDAGTAAPTDAGSEPEAAAAEADASKVEPVAAAEPSAAPPPAPQASPDTPDSGVEQPAGPPRSGPETEFVKGRGRCKKQSDCWPDDCCAPATCVSKKFVRKCKTHHCPDMLGPMASVGAWCACEKGRCGAMYPESHF